MALIQSSNNTGSTLGLENGKNRTSSALSTNIIITVEGGSPVGAIQSLSIHETRTIKMIDEVGTAGHIDSAPQSSTAINGSCNRIRFDAARIAQAFGRGFVHVSSQAYPFNIVIYDISRADLNSQITTVIKNVWIKGITVNYTTSDWVIAETMEWEAETIYSYMGTANNPAVPNGAGDIRNILHSNIDREKLADRGAGGKRGALDVAGLIDLNSNILI